MSKKLWILGGAVVILIVVGYLAFEYYSGMCGNFNTANCSGPCDNTPGFTEAVKSMDFVSCEKIENKNDCADYCVYRIAETSNSGNNCKKVPDLYHRDLCYMHQATNLKDISFCAKMSETDTSRTKSLCETEYYRYVKPGN